MSHIAKYSLTAIQNAIKRKIDRAYVYDTSTIIRAS